jgi:hypothetical protein
MLFLTGWQTLVQLTDRLPDWLVDRLYNQARYARLLAAFSHCVVHNIFTPAYKRRPPIERGELLQSPFQGNQREFGFESQNGSGGKQARL